MKFTHLKALFTLPILLLISLAGCQNSAKKDCEDKNWRQQAYMDALNGIPLKNFQKTQELCQKRFNIEIQNEIYKEGYDLGLAKLCTPVQGFEFGKNGKEYRGTCRERDEDSFLKSYRQGRLEFLKKARQQLTIEIQESKGRVWRKQNEYELEANTNPTAAREVYDVLESYRSELLRLQEEHSQLNRRIADLESMLKTPSTTK